MRLILMGTGPFAVPSFESLLGSAHEVAAVVTRPTSPVQTRGKSREAPNPVRDLAQAHGLVVLAPEDVNSPEACRQLEELRPDLFVVCDYGQILAPHALAIPPFGGINLHGSLLPKYRGAAPLNWAIWRGEVETGVTVLHMTPKLDAGPSLVQVATPIGPDETAAELEPRLARLGVAAVHSAIDQLRDWDRRSPLGATQDPSLATLARRLKKSDGRIAWEQPATAIYRQFRALQPWPGIYCHWLEPGRPPQRLLLGAIQVQPVETAASPGTVLELGKQIVVSTGAEAIRVEQLQPAGKRMMTAEEFSRGTRLREGDRLVGDP